MKFTDLYERMGEVKPLNNKRDRREFRIKRQARSVEEHRE
jgi:hypothetical protein